MLILFYFFASIAACSAIAVISVRNPVLAVLFLVLTFFSVACTWILIGVEFLGIALVLVYVGAVMVLFLFVVMMLDIDVKKPRHHYVRYLPFGLLVAGVMLGELIVLINARSMMEIPLHDQVIMSSGEEISNTQWLAQTLFTEFLLPFEIAAVILTIAVISAVMLTLREKRVSNKHQNPWKQTQVRASERIRLIKMDAVKQSITGTESNEDNA